MKKIISTLIVSALLISQNQAMDNPRQLFLTLANGLFAQRMETMGLDRLSKCQKPPIKQCDNFRGNKTQVIPLVSDEFKIMFKNPDTYIYVPAVKFGTVLSIITNKLVAVGYFGENSKAKVPLFLESIRSNDPDIQSVSLISAFYGPSLQAVNTILEESGIKLRSFCDVFPAIFVGDISEGGKTSCNTIVFASKASLGYDDKENVDHSYNDAVEKLMQKRQVPFKVAFDCSDGRPIDLYQPTYFITEARQPMDTFPNMEIPILPLTQMNVGAMNYFFAKKQLNQEEVSKLVDELDLLNM